MSEKKTEKILEMKSEIKGETGLTFETIILKKLFDADAEEFKMELFKVKVEFSPEEYMKANQCPICGMNFARHEFKANRGLVIEICKPQTLTYGMIPLFEFGKPLKWVKILKQTKLNRQEAVAFIKANRLVLTPNLTLFLLQGR